MTNPYEAPTAVPGSERRTAPSALHRVASILIAAFCGVQFGVLCWSMVAFLAAGGVGPDGAPIPVLQILVAMLMPLSLFLGGIFLVLRRTVAGVFFIAYLAQYLLYAYADGGIKVVPIVMGLSLLAYVVWRWKAGHLKGWPASPAAADTSQTVTK